MQQSLFTAVLFFLKATNSQNSTDPSSQLPLKSSIAEPSKTASNTRNNQVKCRTPETKGSSSTLDKDDICPWNGQNIEDLYKLAQAETGKHTRPFTSFEGGDMRDGRDFTKQAFLKRFPGIKAELLVNYSNQHDIKINEQLKTGELDFDVAHLQSIHDFPIWAKQGHLVSFKPPGFEQVYDEVKDKDGFFVANEMITFAPIVKIEDFQAQKYPIEDDDFLKEEYKDKLVLTFPDHDDAVLYQFYKLDQKYNGKYLDRIKQQNVRWVKGTETVIQMVKNGTSTATFSGGKFFYNQKPEEADGTVMVLPKSSHFLTWGQTVGIFKKAKYPCTAKLYVAWSLTKEYQTETWGMFSARKDINSPNAKPLKEYKNTSPAEFVAFMNNRSLVDDFRAKVVAKLGEANGPDPFNDPNLSGLV